MFLFSVLEARIGLCVHSCVWRQLSLGLFTITMYYKDAAFGLGYTLILIPPRAVSSFLRLIDFEVDDNMIM